MLVVRSATITGWNQFALKYFQKKSIFNLSFYNCSGKVTDKDIYGEH